VRIIRYDSPGVVRLACHGELDLATAGVVHEQVAAALSGAGLRLLVVDLAELTFCDSAGIDALLGARAAAGSRGVTFQVSGARGIVHRSMTATGVLSLLAKATT
jgi:anti-sigma B factor antagonist